MEVGKFPNELKLSKITPIYKKDSDQLLENYRPVSTLHDKQLGFRKYHSTSHTLNYSIDKIKQSIENGDHVLGIFIDLS